MPPQLPSNSLIDAAFSFVCFIINFLMNAVLSLYWFVETLLCLHLIVLLMYMAMLVLYYGAIIALLIIQIYSDMMMTCVNDGIEMYHQSELDFIDWVGDERHYSIF
jgi:hypothetical protein